MQDLFTRFATSKWVAEVESPFQVHFHGYGRVLADETTAFQHAIITEGGDLGRALFLDGKLQSCTADEFIYHEALVHPAMLQHGEPRRVLILGGGEGGTLREVLRWSTIERAVMVDIDERVISLCRDLLRDMHADAFDDPRANVVIEDAFTFMQRCTEQFDVVISDLTDPIGDGPSQRLFSREVFEMCHSLMAEGGMMALQAGPLAPADLPNHARIARGLREVFRQTQSLVVPVPSFKRPWSAILAGNRPNIFTANPASVDDALKKRLTSATQFIDGLTLQGLFAPPKHVREAIERERRSATMNDPVRHYS